MPLQVTDEEFAVDTAITELKGLYKHLTANWHSLKNRSLGLLAGEVAIVSFLFSSGLFYPDETYGQVFFITGIALISIAFGLLLFVLSTATWIVPFDTETSKKIFKKFNTKRDIKDYIKEDYEDCVDFCVKQIALRARLYNISLLMLAGGIIMLLVLRFK